MESGDWKRKLSSRKFWLAVIGFVTAVAAGFGFSEASVGQVTSIIMAGATLIAYILGESWVDGKNVEASLVEEDGELDEEVIGVMGDDGEWK